MYLAKNLRFLRLKNGFSQDYIADILDYKSRGQGFESPRLHQGKPYNINSCGVFMFYSISVIC